MKFKKAQTISVASDMNIEDRLFKAPRGNEISVYRYDYMGRRIEKKVTVAGTVTTHRRFACNGDKRQAEYDALQQGCLDNCEKLVHEEKNIPEDRFTASKDYIYLGRRGDCSAFTTCMKREWPNKEKYNSLTHNCQSAVSNTIRKCLAEQ